MIPFRFSLAMNEVSSEFDVELSAFSDDELGRASLITTGPLTVESIVRILDGVWDLDAEFDEHRDEGEELRFSSGISSLVITRGLESLDFGVFDWDRFFDSSLDLGVLIGALLVDFDDDEDLLDESLKIYRCNWIIYWACHDD